MQQIEWEWERRTSAIALASHVETAAAAAAGGAGGCTRSVLLCHLPESHRDSYASYCIASGKTRLEETRATSAMHVQRLCLVGASGGRAAAAAAVAAFDERANGLGNVALPLDGRGFGRVRIFVDRHDESEWLALYLEALVMYDAGQPALDVRDGTPHRQPRSLGNLLRWRVVAERCADGEPFMDIDIGLATRLPEPNILERFSGRLVRPRSVPYSFLPRGFADEQCYALSCRRFFAECDESDPWKCIHAPFVLFYGGDSRRGVIATPRRGSGDGSTCRVAQFTWDIMWCGKNYWVHSSSSNDYYRPISRMSKGKIFQEGVCRVKELDERWAPVEVALCSAPLLYHQADLDPTWQDCGPLAHGRLPAIRVACLPGLQDLYDGEEGGVPDAVTWYTPKCERECYWLCLEELFVGAADGLSAVEIRDILALCFSGVPENLGSAALAGADGRRSIAFDVCLDEAFIRAVCRELNLHMVGDSRFAALRFSPFVPAGSVPPAGPCRLAPLSPLHAYAFRSRPDAAEYEKLVLDHHLVHTVLGSFGMNRGGVSLEQGNARECAQRLTELAQKHPFRADHEILGKITATEFSCGLYMHLPRGGVRRDREWFVLSGRAGTGKSTLLRKVAAKREPDEWIAFIAPLDAVIRQSLARFSEEGIRCIDVRDRALTRDELLQDSARGDGRKCVLFCTVHSLHLLYDAGQPEKGILRQGDRITLMIDELCLCLSALASGIVKDAPYKNQTLGRLLSLSSRVFFADASVQPEHVLHCWQRVRELQLAEAGYKMLVGGGPLEKIDVHCTWIGSRYNPITEQKRSCEFLLGDQSKDEAYTRIVASVRANRPVAVFFASLEELDLFAAMLCGKYGLSETDVARFTRTKRFELDAATMHSTLSQARVFLYTTAASAGFDGTVGDNVRHFHEVYCMNAHYQYISLYQAVVQIPMRLRNTGNVVYVCPSERLPSHFALLSDPVYQRMFDPAEPLTHERVHQEVFLSMQAVYRETYRLAQVWLPGDIGNQHVTTGLQPHVYAWIDEQLQGSLRIVFMTTLAISLGYQVQVRGWNKKPDKEVLRFAAEVTATECRRRAVEAVDHSVRLAPADLDPAQCVGAPAWWARIASVGRLQCCAELCYGGRALSTVVMLALPGICWLSEHESAVAGDWGALITRLGRWYASCGVYISEDVEIRGVRRSGNVWAPGEAVAESPPQVRCAAAAAVVSYITFRSAGMKAGEIFPTSLQPASSREQVFPALMQWLENGSVEMRGHEEAFRVHGNAVTSKTKLRFRSHGKSRLIERLKSFIMLNFAVPYRKVTNVDALSRTGDKIRNALFAAAAGRLQALSPLFASKALAECQLFRTAVCEALPHLERLRESDVNAGPAAELVTSSLTTERALKRHRSFCVDAYDDEMWEDSYEERASD